MVELKTSKQDRKGTAVTPKAIQNCEMEFMQIAPLVLINAQQSYHDPQASAMMSESSHWILSVIPSLCLCRIVCGSPLCKVVS